MRQGGRGRDGGGGGGGGRGRPAGRGGPAPRGRGNTTGGRRGAGRDGPAEGARAPRGGDGGEGGRAPRGGDGGRPARRGDDTGRGRFEPRGGKRPTRAAPGPWAAGPSQSRSDAKRAGIPARERPRSTEAPQQPRAPRDTPRVEHELLVYGLRSVEALLNADARRIQCLFVDQARARQPDVKKLVDRAGEAGVAVQKLGADALAAMARGAVHQGVAAQVVPFRYSNMEELLLEEPPLLLVLDEVQDPQNLGAAARAAWALGATGLVLPKDRAASVTAAAEKVASGAFAHLAVTQVTNMTRTLTDLRKRGVWIIGLDVDGTAPLWEQDFTMPVALVVGGEHDGMRRLTREHCDAVVKIPMAHRAAALNAADAAAVALYEAARQRARGGAREDADEEE